MKRLLCVSIVMILLATVFSGCVGRPQTASSGIIVPPAANIIFNGTTATPQSAPAPTPEPEPAPFTLKPADHSGRTTHALIGNQWVYMENLYEVYSIPLDAPEGTQPKLLWNSSGFDFFLVWEDDVLLFANPPKGAPMRAIIIDPVTGDYRIFDMRQKEFYFPSWADGDLAYGVNGSAPEIRTLNKQTGVASLLIDDAWFQGASDELFFFTSAYYDRPFVRHSEDLTGPNLEVNVTYEFICGIGGAALVRVDDDIVLVRGKDARLLFSNMPSSRAYNPYLYVSSTPEGEMFTFDNAPIAKDSLGNTYSSGAVYITPAGLFAVNPDEFTNRPASHEGGAILFPSLTTTDLIPIDDYPVYEFFANN